MDYAGLQAEIAKPIYSGMDDPAIAAALVAQNVTVWSDVPIGNIVGYLALNGKLSAITQYAGTDPTTKVITSAFTTLISTSSVTTFQLSDPTTRAAITGFLGVFVSDGILAAADQTALLGMGQSTSSIAQQLGFDVHHDMEQEMLAARRWGD